VEEEGVREAQLRHQEEEPASSAVKRVISATVWYILTFPGELHSHLYMCAKHSMSWFGSLFQAQITQRRRQHWFKARAGTIDFDAVEGDG
jgi:hypothetical protein